MKSFYLLTVFVLLASFSFGQDIFTEINLDSEPILDAEKDYTPKLPEFAPFDMLQFYADPSGKMVIAELKEYSENNRKIELYTSKGRWINEITIPVTKKKKTISSN
ncbi:MAG: hypothetical protein JKY53_08050 [Flavobacteriales bacterium]|nr:hypothetical protein [Flavobacteriales bacterium]